MENIFDDDIKPITRVDFGILSNDEIKRMSALGKDSIGIEIIDLYDNMEPQRGGLIDTRMGVTDGNIDCATCGLDAINCVGHFGHIELAEPVFHMGFIMYVKNILNCVCLKCSKLLVTKNEDELSNMLKNKSNKARFNEVRGLVKNVKYCEKPGYGCGTPVSKIKIESKKGSNIIYIISETTIPSDEGGKKKIRQIITPSTCYDILSNISDTDCRMMGIDPEKCRPETMIHKIFPVPPVATRPSARVDFMASSTKEDHLTHKLADIIKENIRIRKHKESETTSKFSQDYIHLLQFHVGTYFDNEMTYFAKAEQRGKVTNSLSKRLKGKTGRIRNNLMGKRVDFSARTVITPDPSLDVNQMAVPIAIAMDITFPEVVTPNNIEEMDKLVKNGRHKYPGANFVFPVGSMGGRRKVLPIDLRYRDDITLRFGDIVERHVRDNDYVLLNRQPTLHKMSMMGHRIKVINNPKLKTFRLNLAVTKSYNADFDGDEMNIFVPQNIETQIELEDIADVKRQFINAGISAPLIGVVQDGLIGSYNITNPAVRIDWRDAMNLIACTTFDRFDEFTKDREYTGSEIFSMIIPKRINSSSGDLVVKNGQIISGQVKNTHIGTKKTNSLIHQIWNEYGMDTTKDFVDNVQRLVNNFNLLNGFSVGIGDISTSLDLEKQIRNMIETKKLQVYHLITEMENNPGLLDAETFEKSIYGELDSILGNVSKFVIENCKPDNNFIIMLNSGSKGGEVNLGQMGACVGQQSIEGTRIKKKLNNKTTR